MGDLNNRKDKDLHVKFDMTKRPIKMRPYLVPVAWLLSFPQLLLRRHTLAKKGMRGMKPPYILLCNHNAFMDFRVAMKAIFPHTGINIVALDGFIKREWLLRFAGCMCKRKFTNDPVLVRHIFHALRRMKKIVLIYPEARYSLLGTQSMLPDSLGKLIKKAKVPVAMLLTKGHHINSPVWNLSPRKNRLEAEMTKLLDVDDIRKMDVDDINGIIREHFVYDDFRWQQENKIEVTYRKRAEGLHKILYQCPACRVEFEMHSEGETIGCASCGKTYTLDRYGFLRALSGETEFSHPPDWFEWQRANVRTEIESGNYRIEGAVQVDALPNAKGFIDLGEGRLRHDAEGFTLHYRVEGEERILHKDVSSMFGVHVEYDYNDKGDCISFSTLEDTFYMYFKDLPNRVTKIHFATEELYKLAT